LIPLSDYHTLFTVGNMLMYANNHKFWLCLRLTAFQNLYQIPMACGKRTPAMKST
jgi:hypothetical protein